MNVVALVGRLGADPELRYTGEGKAVAKFSIAVNRGKEETDWFDVTAWDAQAEAVAQYCHKGDQVGVTGRLRQERWQTDGGENRSKVVVNAGQVDFLTPKGEREDAP